MFDLLHYVKYMYGTAYSLYIAFSFTRIQEAEKRFKQLQEGKKAALLNTRTRKAGSLVSWKLFKKNIKFR